MAMLRDAPDCVTAAEELESALAGDAGSDAPLMATSKARRAPKAFPWDRRLVLGLATGLAAAALLSAVALRSGGGRATTSSALMRAHAVIQADAVPAARPQYWQEDDRQDSEQQNETIEYRPQPAEALGHDGRPPSPEVAAAEVAAWQLLHPGGDLTPVSDTLLAGGAGAGAVDVADAFAANSTALLASHDETLCSGVGESCLTSKCCKEDGMQCFTKDLYWGQCLETCIPGPNVLDQASSAPWECKTLGDRAPGDPKKCAADGADCRADKCCKSGGMQCFEKDENWGVCRPQCTAGPDLFESTPGQWSCKPIGPRSPGAAPWVASKCAQPGSDCRAAGCCAAPGTQCYKQTDFWAQCLPDCKPGQKANEWDKEWSCDAIGSRTPSRADSPPPSAGKVGAWVEDTCSDEGQNCRTSQCCREVGAQCYTKNEFWASCRVGCDTAPDVNDGNKSWSCNTMGPKSWGLAVKDWPSLFCFSLFMPSSYEMGLMQMQLGKDAGIFGCDGHEVFAAEDATVGTSKDGKVIKIVLIPKIAVGVSQDGTAGNAKLFMAVWDKVIAGGRFRNYDWTLKVDPDAVLLPWRMRSHMVGHTGSKVYVVNCNKFPGSPNFPMMYGAVEVFSQSAMIQYALNSWKCGQQLPWGTWGEDYYMTHCMDFIGVGRIGDFGILGDNMCTGANCADGYVASFHAFKQPNDWAKCWDIAVR